MPALTHDEIMAELKTLFHWAYEGGELSRRFRFRDFTDAFGFVAQAAALQLEMGVVGSVTQQGPIVLVDLGERGGVSDRDIALARRLSERAGNAL
ncbi:MAG: 4a-hydroxytetrahydrobiopterin dehydratase [Chloroflexi bacterium]|nr:4a-hydroxytetrahydrobiopterin dehydratase [Chloroflexota bacterium]